MIDLTRSFSVSFTKIELSQPHETYQEKRLAGLAYHLVSDLSFNHSRSEGINFELLRLLEDVVRIQISTKPYKNNYSKG